MHISANQSRYLARMQRVIDYIDAHPDADLDIDSLATMAAFSPFHFQRQFAATFGITIGRYVQQQRLWRASLMLAFRQHSIGVLALDHGYQSPEAFSRAFRAALGQSPSAFRAAPDWYAWHAAFEPAGPTGASPMTDHAALLRIIDTPDIAVATLAHVGDPRTVGDSVRRFIGWRKAHGWPPSRSRTFNVFHTPPDVDPAGYRMDLCAAVDGPVAANTDGVIAGVIPGGRVATIRHAGPDAAMAAAFDWLYRTWLPASGETLRDFPPYLERLTLRPELSPREAEWQACLPLQR